MSSSLGFLFHFSSPISDAARSHLLKVYSLLTAGVLAAVTGCYLDMHFFHLGGLATALLGALTFGLARSSVAVSYKDNSVGVILFLFAASIQGASLSPLVQVAAIYHPQALPTAFLSTLAVFASFSGAAVMAKRREFFYLGGILGTVASFLAFISLASIVVRFSIIMDIQLYAGLAMFLGYVLLDTQVMIDRFESGQNRSNFVRPACDLFADLIAVFVRILILLMRKNEKRRNSFNPSSASSPERRYYKRQQE